MKPLESRKQLLIAESELNRAQLTQDWRSMAVEAHSLADRARTLRSFATVAAALIAGLAAFRRPAAPPPPEKPSWASTLLKVAGLAATLWSAFRPQSPRQKP
jgi:hypothetical protein